MAHALIIALRRQRKEDLCEFWASLVYKEFEDSQATERNLVSNEKQNKTQKFSISSDQINM